MSKEQDKKQDETIIMRVAPKDKANIKLEAQKKGITMSTLIKSVLMDAKIIEPINIDY